MTVALCLAVYILYSKDRFDNLKGPYEGCQEKICQYNRACMCSKKAEILKCCIAECNTQPPKARDECLKACKPIINPC